MESLSNSLIVALEEEARSGAFCSEDSTTQELKRHHGGVFLHTHKDRVVHKLDQFLDVLREDTIMLRREVEDIFAHAQLSPDVPWTEMSWGSSSAVTSVVSSKELSPQLLPALHADAVVCVDSNDPKSSAVVKGLVHKNFEAAHGRSRLATENISCTKSAKDLVLTAWTAARAGLSMRRLQLRWLEAFAESKHFKAVVFAVLVLNTIVLGVDGTSIVKSAFEYYDGLSTSGEGDAFRGVPQWVETVEEFFFYFYSFELVVRILAHEGLFLVGPDWRWNYFDSLIVFMSVLERVTSAAENSSVFRLLRLMRLTRSSRTVRLLRLFPSLYPLQFMLLSCTNSLPALCWTCVLILIFFFLFSIVLTSAVGYFVADLTHTSETAEALRYHFATVPMCMLTLLLSFIGEVEFREVILSLLEVDLRLAHLRLLCWPIGNLLPGSLS